MSRAGRGCQEPLECCNSREKPPQGWCLQATSSCPLKGQSKLSKKGQKFTAPFQKSSSSRINMYIYFFPPPKGVKYQISSELQQAGENLEPGKNLFRFFKAKFKAEQKKSQLFQELKSKAYKLFKRQGNPPDHQHRKRIHIKQKCKSSIRRRKKKKNQTEKEGKLIFLISSSPHRYSVAAKFTCELK